MPRQYGPVIQIETDTWIVMREVLSSPKGIIHRVTDVSGAERFLLMRWTAAPADRRLVGIYETIEAAAQAVPGPTTRVPGPPGGSPADAAADMRRRGVTGTGFPG